MRYVFGHASSDPWFKLNPDEIVAEDLPVTVSKEGFVYLLKSGTGEYKIGRTRDVPTRVNTLKIQLPFRIELVHSIRVSDYVKAEQYLHQKFSSVRLNGEWFNLSFQQVTWFCSQTTIEGLY